MNQYTKSIIASVLFLAVMPLLAQKGVGINTSELASGSALQINSTTGSLVLPRVSNAEMLEITDVLDGAIVFNTTNSNWYIRIDGIWSPYAYNDTPSLILNKENEALTLTEEPLLLPLNATHILQNSSGYYKVVSESELGAQNATIEILRDGLYLVTAGMSTTNLPSGPRKYKVLLFVNGALESYLTSGNVNLQASDYWGTSGNSPVLLQANDVVQIKYILDGAGNISGKFFNIGISKL